MVQRIQDRDSHWLRWKFAEWLRALPMRVFFFFSFLSFYSQLSTGTYFTRFLFLPALLARLDNGRIPVQLVLPGRWCSVMRKPVCALHGYSSLENGNTKTMHYIMMQCKNVYQSTVAMDVLEPLNRWSYIEKQLIFVLTLFRNGVFFAPVLHCFTSLQKAEQLKINQ